MIDFLLGMLAGMCLIFIFLVVSRSFINYWLDLYLHHIVNKIIIDESLGRKADVSEFNESYEFYRTTMMRYYNLVKKIKGW